MLLTLGKREWAGDIDAAFGVCNHFLDGACDRRSQRSRIHHLHIEVARAVGAGCLGEDGGQCQPFVLSTFSGCVLHCSRNIEYDFGSVHIYTVYMTFLNMQGAYSPLSVVAFPAPTFLFLWWA